MQLSPRFQKFLKTATKKDIEDMKFLLEHREYQHVPVSMKEFIDNQYYTGPGDYVRPKIKELLIEFFDSGESFDDFEKLGKYEEFLLIAGIGAGKSFLASTAIKYVLYRLLCLENPQKYFHLSSKSFIAFINVSRSKTQARDVVFGEIKNRIDNSPWFQKNYVPDPRIKSVLRFPKNIFILPLGSNEEAPLGYSIFGAILDEASFHTSTKDKDYAELAHTQISSRITSRFHSNGKMFTITSPRFVHDFAETKYAEDLRNTVFRRRVTTWDALPPEQFKGEKFDLGKYLSDYKGTLVPVEYEDDFRQNPERAMRDFGARPSLAIQGLFRDPKVVSSAANLNRMAPIEKKSHEFRKWFFSPLKNKHFDNERRFIHIDLALNRDGRGDKAAIAMGKFDSWVEIKREDNTIERRPKIYIDYMEVFSAKPGTEIKFKDIRQKIYDLREKGFNVSKITFDGYQSTDSIQILRDSGFRSELFSVDRNPESYYMLKSAILEGRLDFYRHVTLIQELQQIEEIDGKKVDHPYGGSKDLADAVAGVVYHCSQRTPGSGILGA